MTTPRGVFCRGRAANKDCGKEFLRAFHALAGFVGNNQGNSTFHVALPPTRPGDDDRGACGDGGSGKSLVPNHVQNAGTLQGSQKGLVGRVIKMGPNGFQLLAPLKEVERHGPGDGVRR